MFSLSRIVLRSCRNEFRAILDAIRFDTTVRVCILNSAVPKVRYSWLARIVIVLLDCFKKLKCWAVAQVFCAGADLKERAVMSKPEVGRASAPQHFTPPDSLYNTDVILLIDSAIRDKSANNNHLMCRWLRLFTVCGHHSPVWQAFPCQRLLQSKALLSEGEHCAVKPCRHDFTSISFDMPIPFMRTAGVLKWRSLVTFE
jgi:hypothetical protein